MIQLFDTPSQKLAFINPLEPNHNDKNALNEVHIYVCGITPYDSAHLGHVFTFLAYDLLQRRLEDLGHTVKLVRNITDVDEPIYKKAAENGEDYKQLAQRETESFQTTMKALDFRPPFTEPRASEYINEMAEAVANLLDAGYAYKLENDIYFDTAKAKNFGSFSGFSDRLLLAFMADRGGDPERTGKHAPLDFLLWRGISDPADTAAWDSPAGYGRPGWHIECSIMSAATLGTPLTIHGGGMDLIFPHHECEIAQSEALAKINGANAFTNEPFVKHWMHVAPILYQGEKMSKSLGNLVFAQDLLKNHDPAVIRLAMMQLHYRTGGEWRHDALECAQNTYDNLRQSLSHSSQVLGTVYIDKVRAALDDDLDTHTILHLLRDLTKETLALSTSNNDKLGQANPIAADFKPTQLKQILDLLGLQI